MNLRQRIAEINKRMTDLQTELDTATAERIADIEKECRTLKDEREKLTRQLADEARNAFDGGTTKPTTAETDNGISTMSKRDKMAFIVGKQARKKAFTDIEKRALGVALTTTVNTYQAATAELDGANNAGIFIGTKLVLDLLKEEGKLSPIFADIAMTAVPGLIDYPYRASRTKGKYKAEGASGTDNQMEWTKLSLSKGYLQTIIPITDEVQALTDFDFGAYIISQILQDLNEDSVEQLIYGTGDSQIKGITVGATAAVANGYTGDVTAAVIAGIKQCKGKFRRGAKLYVAQNVADDVLFSVDDNGNFKYPIFNGTGITSIGTVRMEVDENLKDGEFIIGNVNKYFKVNSLFPMRVETDRHATKGITEYIASIYCAAAPFPGAFIHGTKRA